MGTELTDVIQHPEQLVFIDHCLPQLAAGPYTVSASLDVNSKGGFTDVSKDIFVDAPRFSLDQSDIYDVYPAKNSSGNYANSLPHIVLNRRTLPWERTINGQPYPAQKDNKERPSPWMALLVFDATEMNGNGNEEDAIKAEKRSLKNIFIDTPPGYTVPHIDPAGKTKPYLSAWEDTSYECTVIDIPCRLFTKVMPAAKDLPYLAHVRKVSVDGYKEAIPGEDKDYFATVISHRLPAQSTRAATPVVHTAFLVSLEGFQFFFDNPESITSGKVTMVVLESWNFTVTTEGTFEQICEQLSVRPLRYGYPAHLSERLRDIYNKGYCLLPYHQRNGTSGYCWYRGPLNPGFIPARAETRVVAYADELLRFDQETGIFDISYAAAWQLGRLLALKDKTFSTEYFRWKGAWKQAETEMMEQKSFSDQLPAFKPFAVTNRNSPDELIKDYLFKQQYETQLTSIVENSFGTFARAAAESAEPIGFEQFYRDYILAHDAELRSMDAEGNDYSSRLRSFVKQQFEAKEGIVREEVPAETESDPVPPLVKEWLGNLLLLQGVPFDYLIPDKAYLSAERNEVQVHEVLSTFYIDYDWLEALISGALSIVPAGNTVSLLDAIKAGKLLPGNLKLNKTMSPDISGGKSGEPVPTPPDLSGHVTGFIMRSQLVSSWKGIKIYAKDPSRKWMDTPLRIEKLADDILLCVFSGKCSRVVIMQPPEGLHFAVDKNEEHEQIKYLKRLPDGDLSKEEFILIDTRNKDQRTLNLAVIAHAMEKEIGTGPDSVHAAMLAFQMTASPLIYELKIED